LVWVPYTSPRPPPATVKGARGFTYFGFA
jgi:hypothetical protein